MGSNPGCGTDGFAVSKGWDPVTGLGEWIFMIGLRGENTDFLFDRYAELSCYVGALHVAVIELEIF